ncbi:hypothetical protein [Streptomyces sp. SR-10]|uniref:hypothetical protein n=1 Tax=Streptomyces sp. SR-10 TaxID=3416442 RepID=UPI003CEE1CC9
MPATPDRPADLLRVALIVALDNANHTHPCQATGSAYWTGCYHPDGTGPSCHSERRADAVLAVLPAPALAVARQLLGTTTCAGVTPSADRRARYAAATRETDGWVLDDGRHMIDAVMAVADTEVVQAMRAMHDTKEEERQAHRLALSEALGLGTGAPWDAIRDRAAELAAVPPAPAVPLPKVWTVWVEDESTLGHCADEVTAKLAAIEHHQESETPGLEFVYGWNERGGHLELLADGNDTGIRVKGSRVHGAPPTPADRAAVLAEVADALDQRAAVLKELSSSDYGEESFAARELTEQAADLRRLAGEAAAGAHHPTEPPTHQPKGTNAEDCPACAGANPPYPFLCPGPTPAVPAAPEETR